MLVSSARFSPPFRAAMGNVYTSKFKYMHCWNAKLFNVQFTKASSAGIQRGTSNNVHYIYSRSERCGNLHALQGAEQGPKARRESPLVCETGCRNPCEKLIEKKPMSPLNRPKTVSSETNARLDWGWNVNLRLWLSKRKLTSTWLL